MDDRRWQTLPGSRSKVFPFLRKPDITSSNSYVVETRDEILIIDPGADRQQLAEEVSTVASVREGRNVNILLTHCHLDHCLLAGEALMSIPDAAVVAHLIGAAALSMGDGGITQADIMGVSFPRTPVAVQLMRPGEWIEDQGRKVQTHPLGGEDMLMIHAPGHSPDSMCFVIGDAVFTGDLTFAADPGIAGLLGWSQPDLIRSLSSAIGSMSSMEVCLPGHGRVMDRGRALRVMGRALEQARGLEDIALNDVDKVREDALYARDVLTQASDGFAVIAGRLLYLSFLLEELDEAEAASRYMHLLDVGSIEEALDSLQRFVEEYDRGWHIGLQVTLKAVQTLQRIDRLFCAEGLEDVMGASLVRRTERMLTDFISAVNGIPFRVERRVFDLDDAVNALIERQVSSPNSDEELMDALDDEERYVALLAARIVHLPVLSDIPVRRELGCGHEAIGDPERLGDALACVLEELVGLGAEVLSVHTWEKEGRLHVRVDARGGARLGDPDIRTLDRLARLAGACLDSSDPLILSLSQAII